jgi:hypothetical protein
VLSLVGVPFCRNNIILFEKKHVVERTQYTI